MVRPAFSGMVVLHIYKYMHEGIHSTVSKVVAFAVDEFGIRILDNTVGKM